MVCVKIQSFVVLGMDGVARERNTAGGRFAVVEATSATASAMTKSFAALNGVGVAVVWIIVVGLRGAILTQTQ